MLRLKCWFYKWYGDKGKEVKWVTGANLQGTDTIAGCRCRCRCKWKCRERCLRVREQVGGLVWSGMSWDEMGWSRKEVDEEGS
jgi:hypothetical protein